MRNYFQNAVYNGFGFVFPAAVALFTTPYIVHKLTPEIYGIYILVISIMGLMSFLDLGFGQGIVKFVAQYEAKEDYERINGIIGTSLVIYVIMGLLGYAVISSLSGILVHNVFKISIRHAKSALIAFQIAGIGFFISMLNGIVSNIPRALQRYDLVVKVQNAVWFFSTMSAIVLLYL